MTYRLVTTKKIYTIDTLKYVFIGGLTLILLSLLYIYKDKPYVTDIIKNQNKDIQINEI